MHQSSSRAPHWSTDFVEHLRTVHFALITVATALIIVNVGTSDLVSRASSQAARIARSPAQWAVHKKEMVSTAARQANVPMEQHLAIELTSPDLPTGHYTGRIDLKLEYSLPQTRGTEILNQNPLYLTNFRTMWDTLHNGATLHVPRSGTGPIGCSAHIPPSQIGNKKVVEISNNNASRSHCQITPVSNIGTQASTVFATIVWGQPFESAGRTVIEMKASDQYPSPDAFTISALVEVLPQTIHENALGPYFMDEYKRNGKFDVAFSELASVANEFNLDYIELKQLPDRLTAMQTKAEPGIEIIGLKIPQKQITRWGAVLLLAVQLYFWLHLHELTGRIDPASPGWDVAWIGVYRSMLALVSMLITSCALPFVAALYLGEHIKQPYRPVAWILYTACASLSIATGIRLIILHRSIETRATGIRDHRRIRSV